MALPNLRRLFSSFRTEEEERDFSRTAFFNLVGFLATSALFSIIAQKANDNLIVQDFSNPGDKFSTGLARLQQSAREQLSVTEFITQYDELRQIDTFAGLERETTAQMLDGVRVHELLDVQTALPAPRFDVASVFEGPVPAELTKFVDLLDKLCALADPQFRSVREMRMRGLAPNGCLLRGIIDGVDVTPQGLVVTETKTTRSKALGSYQVRLAYHQALTYNWMLRTFLEAGSVRTLAEMFGLAADAAMLAKLLEVYPHEMAAAERAIDDLRRVGVAPYVRLQFLKSSNAGYADETLEADFDESVLRDVFRSRIDLFEGRRSPILGTLREADAAPFVPTP